MCLRVHRGRELTRREMFAIQRNLQLQRRLRLGHLQKKGLIVRPHLLQVSKETYLGHDEELGELGKPNYRLKYRLLPRIEIRPDHKTKRIGATRPLWLRGILVAISLAHDLFRVRIELAVSRKRAIAHKVINGVPAAPVVRGIVSLGTAFRAPARRRAVLVADPDKVIRLRRVKLHDLRAEGVGSILGVRDVPVSPCVRSVVVLIGRGDEECPVVRVLVVVKREELLAWNRFLPVIAFVA